MSVQEVNKTTGETSLIAGATLYVDGPIGTIIPYGGATAPEGWFLCQGQALSRTEYSELFTVIGTSFGAGDGSTTFNLPDMREVAPVGAGTSTRSGIATHDTYNVGEFKDDQFQSHVHDVYPANAPSGGNMTYLQTYTGGTGSGVYGSRTGTARSSDGRNGATTHGKQLGVNYIIRAKIVALPLDMQEVVDTKLDKTGDSKDNVTAFTSSDVADGSATSWTSVTKLDSGEKHSSIFAKVSQMFKNVRYLYKLLGTTDVSSFFGGSGQSVTDALSTLNTHIGSHTVNKNVPSDAVFTDSWRPVVNNLTSTSTTSSLSAYQGKVLDGKVTDLNNIMFPTINNIDYKFVWLRFSQTSDSAKTIFLRGKVNGVAKNLVASEVYGAITFCCSASYNITHGWFLNSSNAWRSYIDSANTTTTLVVLALVSSNVNLTSEL